MKFFNIFYKFQIIFFKYLENYIYSIKNDRSYYSIDRNNTVSFITKRQERTDPCFEKKLDSSLSRGKGRAYLAIVKISILRYTFIKSNLS